eukprot:gene2431-biopygen11462
MSRGVFATGIELESKL